MPPLRLTASPEASIDTKETLALTLTIAPGCSLADLAQADRFDDIIKSGELRYAVIPDPPPMDSRDTQNNPVGPDIDYCNDLVKAPDVKTEVVETPSPSRISALVSGCADAIVTSTSSTLEWTETIGIGIPYSAFVKVVLTREDTGIASYKDLRSRLIGGTADILEALVPGKNGRVWGDAKGSFRAYQSETDTVLAASQGHIDATVVSSTTAAPWIKSGKYRGLKITGDAPYDIDCVALGAKRSKCGLLNYLNLLTSQQAYTGHYAELVQKWVDSTAPELTANAVYR